MAALFVTPADASGPCDIIDALYKVENQSMAVAGAKTDAQAISGAKEMAQTLDRIDWRAALRLGPVLDPSGARLLLRAYAQSRWKMAGAVRAEGLPRARLYLDDATYIARAGDLQVLATEMGCIVTAEPRFLTFSDPLKLPTGIAYGALAITLAVLSLAISIISHYRELDNRLSRRKNCLIEVSVQIDGHQYTTKMVELGRGGAKLKIGGAVGLAPKRAVSIQWDDQWHAAQIAWCNNYFAGLQFTHALLAGDVDTAIKHPEPYDPSHTNPMQAAAAQGTRVK